MFNIQKNRRNATFLDILPSKKVGLGAIFEVFPWAS